MTSFLSPKSVFKITELISFYLKNGRMSQEIYDEIKAYVSSSN